MGAGLKIGGWVQRRPDEAVAAVGDATNVARDMRAEGLDTQLNAQWARVRGRLRAEFGEAAFRSWLKPMVLLGQNGSEVRIGVPSRFMRDWVVAHYADRLRVLWAGENPAIRTVEIVVDGQRPQAGKAVSTATRLPAAAPAPAPEAAGNGRAEGHEDVGAPLDPRFTFENFVV